MTTADRIKAPRPKKILALDDGGIRGMITVAALAEIESFLRKKRRRAVDFDLCPRRMRGKLGLTSLPGVSGQVLADIDMQTTANNLRSHVAPAACRA